MMTLQVPQFSETLRGPRQACELAKGRSYVGGVVEGIFGRHGSALLQWTQKAAVSFRKYSDSLFDSAAVLLARG